MIDEKELTIKDVVDFEYNYYINLYKILKFGIENEGEIEYTNIKFTLHTHYMFSILRGMFINFEDCLENVAEHPLYKNIIDISQQF